MSSSDVTRLSREKHVPSCPSHLNKGVCDKNEWKRGQNVKKNGPR